MDEDDTLPSIVTSSLSTSPSSHGPTPISPNSFSYQDCMGLSPHAIENIISQIKNPITGFELKDRKYRMKTYAKCFVGSDAVTWFYTNFKFDREYTVELMGFLMKVYKLFDHVCEEQPFKDDYVLYKFKSRSRISVTERKSPMTTTPNTFANDFKITPNIFPATDIQDVQCCVIGASGYLGSFIVKELLERGCKVRAQVREIRGAQKRYGYLLDLCTNENAQLEFVEGDLEVEGSFDQCVAGCKYVFHAAQNTALSYCNNYPAQTTSCYDPIVSKPTLSNATLTKKLNESDIQSLVNTCTRGMVNLLSSCEKSNTVRKVIITSCTEALYDQPPLLSQTTHKEDWNTESTVHRHPLYLSKKATEEAAWDYIRTNKPSFALISIIPSLMIGPLLTREHMSVGHFLFRDILQEKFKHGNPNVGSGFVDVRDVARAHLAAATTSTVTGGRYICDNHSLTLQELCIAIEPQFSAYFIALYSIHQPWKFNANYKSTLSKQSRRISDAESRTDPSVHDPPLTKDYQWFNYQYLMMNNIDRIPRFDNSKICEMLKLEFISIRQSLLDTATSLIDHQLVQKKSPVQHSKQSSFLPSFSSIADSQFSIEDDFL